MGYSKTLLGNTVTIPETGDTNYGANGTAILDDLVDIGDQSFTMISGVVIPYHAATSSVLAAAATLTPANVVHKVSGSGGAVTLSGTTAIANGSVNGQVLILQGDHATNTVTIQNGANVQLRGEIVLGLYDFLCLRWDTTIGDWIEMSRSASQKLRNQSGIEFFELATNGSNKITITAPASLAGDVAMTLPNVNASGFLQNNGTGTLSWGSASAVTMDNAYDGGSSITVDTAAVTFTVTAAINGLTINKTNTGAGQCIDIDNDGTGAAIRIVQDGANYGLEVNRPTGGQVVRVRAATSGDPYTSIESASGREARMGAINAGNVFYGSGSNHGIEFRVNNVAKFTIDTSGNLTQNGLNGNAMAIQSATNTVNLTGATTDLAGLIPAGCLLIGVVCRVNTTETGCTSIQVGIAGTPTRFASAMGVSSGSTSDSGTDGAETSPRIYPTATSIRFTAVGGAASFATGVVRVVTYYIDLTAPTS